MATKNVLAVMLKLLLFGCHCRYLVDEHSYFNSKIILVSENTDL
jgi:hypothetical protein